MRANRLSGCLIGLVATVGLASAALAGPPPDGVFVGFDFNADGKGDIARSSSAAIRTNILDGTVSTAFGNFPTGGGSFILKGAGNCDNDENADLVAQGGGTIRVTFVSALGIATKGTLFFADGGGTWNVVDVADVTGDGIDDVISYGTGAALGAMRIANIASGSAVFSFFSTAGGLWVYAFAADVNGDGQQDLLFRGTGAAAGTVRANLSGTATQKFYAQGGTTWGLTAAGDMNNDGTDDLADTGLGGTAVGFNRVRTLNTSGDIIATGFVGNGANTFILRAIADFTNDGNSDLLYNGAGSMRVTPMTGVTPGGNLFPGNSSGSFSLRESADTNGDGFFDLVLTNAGNDVRLQTSNGTSTTTIGTPIAATGLTLFTAP